MKLKHLIKSKLFKWTSVAVTATAIVSATTSLVSNLNHSSPLFTDTPTKRESNFEFYNNTNYQLIEDPIINLDQKFSNIYINLLKDPNNNENPLSGSSELVNAIKNALKISNYWVDNNMPEASTLDFEINNLINSYKNPLLNFQAPAITITPLVAVDNTIKRLPSCTVTIVGTKLANGVTHGYDTVKNENADDLKTASFIYIPKTFNPSSPLTALNADALKEYLFNNPDLLNTIFNNLPELNPSGDSLPNISSVGNGQFKLGKNGFNISSPSLISSNNDYKIYQYPITIDRQFLLENNLYIPSTLLNSFNINVYYPTNLINGSIPQDTIQTYVPNVLLASSDNTIKDLSASALESLRKEDPVSFKSAIVNCLKASSLNLSESLTSDDIIIDTPTNQYVNNNDGYCRYILTLKKVKINDTDNTEENNYLRTNIIIGGLKPTYETKFTNTYSIAGINSLANTYASSYANNNQILETLASSTSSISNSSPSFIYQGSFDESGSGSPLKKLFAATYITTSYNQVKYDDNTGTISNINITIRGYYDKNGNYNKSQNKNFTINLTGFKQSKVDGITAINNIIVDKFYADYPAQSFLFPTATRKEKLMEGELPTNISNINDELINNSGEEIKKLIKENAVNLPQQCIDDIAQWELKNLNIKNFNGMITGKVYLPSYYAYVNNDSHSNLVITQNKPSSNPNAKWFSFNINGFDNVPGQTVINPFTTSAVIIKNEYGVYAEKNASLVTLDEYMDLINSSSFDQTSLAFNTIKYWMLDNNKIVANRWTKFNEQMMNNTVGIQNITLTPNKTSNILDIYFDFYYFNEYGQYQKKAIANTSNHVAKITIKNFKPTEGIKKTSIISSGATISLSLFDYPMNIYERGEFLNIMNKEINNDPSYKAHLLLNNLTKLISSLCVSEINQNKLPEYFFKAGPISPSNQNENVPLDPDRPGSLYFYVQFKNNFYDTNGKFISVPISTPIESRWVKLEINNFMIVSDTSIANIINAPSYLANDINGQPLLASQVSQSTSNYLNNIKKAVVSAIFNPASTENPHGNVDSEKPIPDEYKPFGKPIETSSIPEYTGFDVNGQAINDGLLEANNGVNYFGEVNDFEGTLTVYLRFKADTWYKDSEIQKVPSDVKQVVIHGFKKLKVGDNSRTWYNNNIKINTKDLTADVENDYNELASNLCGNVSSSLVDETIKRIKEAGVVKSAFANSNESWYIDNNALDIKMNVAKNQATNQNGSLFCELSTYGNNVFDPATGLYYTDPNHPLSFDVYLTGFNEARKTIYNNDIVVPGKSLITAPQSISEIKNNLYEKENLNNLFSNSLPDGFTRSEVAIHENINKYLFIPELTQNNQENITVDYANGNIRIKEMALLNYINNDFNLVFDRTKIVTPTTTWKDINSWTTDSWKPLIINDISIGGYMQMAPTTINSVVGISDPNFRNLLPTLFIENLKKKPVEGVTDENDIASKIANTLIYLPAKNDEGTPNKNPVNNLSLFFKNYNTNIPQFAPNFKIDPSSIVEDNIKGTITFKIVITNNFFYINGDKLLFKDNNNNDPSAKPIEQVVTLTGFQVANKTVINNRINLNDLDNGAPELVEERRNLFWYNINPGTNNDYVETKEKIINLIRDNLETFIHNYYNYSSNENLSDYVEIVDFNANSTDFASGTINFKIKLSKYISTTGKIYDETLEQSTTPLESSIQIFGFKPVNATAPYSNSSSIDLLEININNYDYLKTLDYYCNDQMLANAFLNSPIYDNQAEIISSNFKNIPPSTIFEFKTIDENDPTNVSKQSLKDVELRLNPITPDQYENGDAYRTGTITLNNILVLDTNNQAVHIGKKQFNLKLVGFGNRVETSLKTDLWNLSTSFNKLAQEFDNINISETSLSAFLNQSVLYNGNDVPLFTAFISNARIDSDPKTEIIINSIENNDPANGIVKIKISIKNYYDQSGTLQTSTPLVIPEMITLSGFKVQLATTPVTSSSIASVVPINILPSELLDKYNPGVAANKIHELIEILNNPGNLKSLFQNYNKDETDKAKKFCITNVEVISVDDELGSIRVKLTVKNYYSQNGKFETGEFTFNNIFNIVKLDYARPTEINANAISLDEYFGNGRLPWPTHPSAINTFIPSQYVAYINTKLIEAKAAGKNDAAIMKVFNDYISELILPVYNLPENYQVDFPVDNSSTTETKILNTLNQENDSNVPFVYKLNKTPRKNILTFQSFTQAKGTNLFEGKILIPGCEYAIDEHGNYNIKPNSIQSIESIWTSFNYSLVNSNHIDEFNVNRCLEADDRLGTLTFKFNVKGIWRIAKPIPTEDNKVLIKTKSNAKEMLTVDLTLTGFKKDLQVQETLSNTVVIAASVGGSILALIIIVAAILMIKKFTGR